MADERFGVAADVAGAGPLRRRLFFEGHALPFIELVEAALDRAPMEEPLLPAVVADETETPVPNESLDRAAWHSTSPWAPREPKERALQISFHERLATRA